MIELGRVERADGMQMYRLGVGERVLKMFKADLDRTLMYTPLWHCFVWLGFNLEIWFLVSTSVCKGLT